MTYPMTIAGIKRELPLCKVADDFYIGAFIMFGDAEITVWDDRLESVTSQTTSGDLTIRLPESLRGQARVDMHTVSGDCRNRFGTPEGPAKVIVQAKSVSGDVTVK